MRLKDFKQEQDYIFDLYFEDGTKKVADLSELIKSKVSTEELKTARIDKEWGCLEFKNGMIDIEPNTLYNFSIRATTFIKN